ncbi:MAG: EpsI family protein [Immundisolibacteraceae bacterium]|nr:EpsI family protein [Immundisolibacteraceae bacterium]
MAIFVDDSRVWLRGWWAVIFMVAVSVGLGYLFTEFFKDRAWRKLDDTPQIIGFREIDQLPAPFRLNYPGASQIWSYVDTGDQTKFICIVFYQQEMQGKELVSSGNTLVGKERWEEGKKVQVVVEQGGGENVFSRVVHQHPVAGQIVVSSQYRFASLSNTTNPLAAKLLALRDGFMGSNGSAQINTMLLAKAGSERERQPLIPPAIFEVIAAVDLQIMR